MKNLPAWKLMILLFFIFPLCSHVFLEYQKIIVLNIYYMYKALGKFVQVPCIKGRSIYKTNSAILPILTHVPSVHNIINLLIFHFNKNSTNTIKSGSPVQISSLCVSKKLCTFIQSYYWIIDILTTPLVLHHATYGPINNELQAL